MPRKISSRRASEAGFSLIEILVSLGIIAMLAGFVGPQVIGYFARAKVQTAEAQIKGVRAALDLYDGRIDGRHGPVTRRAIRSFQQAWTLRRDGKAGPRTQRVLAYVTASFVGPDDCEVALS